MTFRLITGLLAFAGAVAGCATKTGNLEKWDPAMAVASDVVVDGVKWIDGHRLPIEGRAFDDTEHYYDRLPASVTEKVNPGVRGMKHNTAGLQFRFKTDSKHLHFRWTPYNKNCHMYHMPSTGHSGIDIYAQGEDGVWRYVRTGGINFQNEDKTGKVTIGDWKPGTPCLVNLPLYNGVESFTLGIDEGAKVEPLGPRASGVDKPVVFYGTSITHGGCASRPGLAFPSIVGRNLDVPIVNLGFSGSGRMEFEMVDHLARIDASCYVLDCLWNMNRRREKGDCPWEADLAAGGVTDEPSPSNTIRYFEVRYEKFIRALRAKRPDVPIVMAESCDVFCRGPNEKDRYIRALYEKLVAEGWQKLVYLPKEGMYTGDLEGTVDGCHPNDWGMMSMARAFGGAIRTALKIQ